MLRSEVQRKTGLTRKAIEYYEKRGLIEPKRGENDYRDYSEGDLKVLKKISLYRKLGLIIPDIEEILSNGTRSLSSILRKKEYQLEVEGKRKNILESLIKDGENEDIIDELNSLEVEENLYQRLERAFPGYFGQMLFFAYQPFLNEPIREGGEGAYRGYVKYLDDLPTFELTAKEKDYIEEVSSTFDINLLKEVNNTKVKAVEDFESWLLENEDDIKEYENFKNSEDYLKSTMKEIQEKLKEYMIDNKYYELAIPLIRGFSKSYDDYYCKLLEANDRYIELHDK